MKSILLQTNLKFYCMERIAQNMFCLLFQIKCSNAVRDVWILVIFVVVAVGYVVCGIADRFGCIEMLAENCLDAKVHSLQITNLPNGPAIFRFINLYCDYRCTFVVCIGLLWNWKSEKFFSFTAVDSSKNNSSLDYSLALFSITWIQQNITTFH